jgi:hypothetical protein
VARWVSTHRHQNLLRDKTIPTGDINDPDTGLEAFRYYLRLHMIRPAAPCRVPLTGTMPKDKSAYTIHHAIPTSAAEIFLAARSGNKQRRNH